MEETLNELALFAGASVKTPYVYGAAKICPVCSSAFRARDADTKTYQSKFCSGACRNKARAIHKSAVCVMCAAYFKPIRAGHVCCSRKCGTAYRLSRQQPDPMVESRKKLAVFCCGLIARCMRNKTDRTAAMLGYTVKELRAHLEKHFQPGMSWANYGKGDADWSIDHTRPITSFPPEATVGQINALQNLRPMWHRENCAKKNKW